MRKAPVRTEAPAIVTVYDVAAAAGVSTATVSRVVHGSELVRPSTRDRVLLVIDELGFVPDGSAQGLSRRRKDIVGLVSIERDPTAIDVERTSLLFIDQVIRAVEEELREREFSLLLSIGPRGEAFDRRVRALTGKVDGILVSEGFLPEDERRRLARRVPLVYLAGRKDQRGVDVVRVDNRGGISALVRHLIEVHGRRNFCFVRGPVDSPDAQERFSAFRDTIRRHPGTRAELTVQGAYSEASGASAVSEILRLPELPDAVVCANDQMAIGAMRAFQRAGLQVPARVAVVGFDDIYAGQLVRPTLTTVRQPIREAAMKATAQLLARIADPVRPETVEVLPTELVVRESCGCSP